MKVTYYFDCVYTEGVVWQSVKHENEQVGFFVSPGDSMQTIGFIRPDLVVCLWRIKFKSI